MAMIERDHSDKELRLRLRVLCQRVLKGEVDVPELAASVPREHMHPFYRQVVDDLADAVEHTPGKWFSGKLDVEAWHASEGYLNVYLDDQLLAIESQPDDLSKLRTRILAHRVLSQATIDREIKAASTSASSG